MARKRTSIIWTTPILDFEEIIKKSTSYREVLGCFGLESKGNNFRTLKKRIQEQEIDDSHIRNRPQNMNAIIKSKIDDSLIFCKNSDYSRTDLKKRLIKDNLIEHRCCAECGLHRQWNNKELNLTIDHINGESKDNRIDNLRFLCPNCHSQTITFAGKRFKRTHMCEDCGSKKKTKSKYCYKCGGKNNRKVKDRPSKEELIKLIKELPYTKIGTKYGVSDNAVRKWAKSYGIID